VTVLPVVLILAASSPQEAETKKIPKDSVEIATRGCLKGRVFTATPAPEGEGARHGPDVTGRHFRVSGPKDIMKVVKEHNGHLVEVVGLIRKSALSDPGIGMKVGGTRVVIGAPGTDPDRSMHNQPVANVNVMDLTSIGFLSNDCPID
jgi:hypothetical protein